VLDLGRQPIANRLLDRPDDLDPRYPLGLQVCTECGLGTLTHMVHHAELYRDYPFRSGTSQQWKDHCAELAQGRWWYGGPNKRVSRPRGAKSPLVLDVGANDGTLLHAFRKFRWTSWAVEPNPPDDVAFTFPVTRAYWGYEEGVKSRHYIHMNYPDMVVATNVFAHTPDPLDFLRGIQAALRETGVAVIEVQHFGYLMEHWAFDTIYHEHMWFWWTKPMTIACDQVGLKIVDMSYYPNLHGGSVRYVLRHKAYDYQERLDRGLGSNKMRTDWPHDMVRWASCLDNERKVLEGDVYTEFANGVQAAVEEFRRIFADPARPAMAAYGASAKGATFLNAVKATPETITAVVDDAPAKQGKYMPGSNIPIVAEIPEGTEMLLLLSWNVAPDLIQRALDAGYTGDYLIPMPVTKVIGAEQAEAFIHSCRKRTTGNVNATKEFLYA
jgi:SAM-dependent methyltransferase